jgi:general secretion pathway protein G
MREEIFFMRLGAMKKNVARRGFTLMEMLLVVVIIAILAAVVAPMVLGRGDQARVSAAKGDISSLDTGFGQFKLDVKRFPTEQEGIQALLDDPGSAKGWAGPYISKPPMDPWGNAYKYRLSELKSRMGYDVYSMGPDGQDNTPDDIGNW